LTLELSPTISYLNQFQWSFNSEAFYNINERISFGVNYRREESGEQRIGVGVRIRF